MKTLTSMSDFKTGNVYLFIFPDGDITIFRATENLENCTSINPWNINNKFNGRFDVSDDYDDIQRYSEATDEACMWLEYCEQHDEYRTKEEALDHMMVKQFIQEYLTEEHEAPIHNK